MAPSALLSENIPLSVFVRELFLVCVKHDTCSLPPAPLLAPFLWWEVSVHPELRRDCTRERTAFSDEGARRDFSGAVEADQVEALAFN